MSLSGVLADSQGSSKEGTINTNISATKMPSMASVLWWWWCAQPVCSVSLECHEHRGAGEHVLGDTQLNPQGSHVGGLALSKEMSGRRCGCRNITRVCPGSRVCLTPFPVLQRLSVYEVTSSECRSLLAFIILNKAYILKLSCTFL